MSSAPITSSITPPAVKQPINLDALSPAMRQYQQFKMQYPDYVLFFRMGDFYEMFWEDAKTAAKVLGVALTSRNKGAADEIPMAGVPFHAVENYLRKMIAAGQKVAICEQTEDPTSAKGLIKREVVRLMTPGTLTDDPLLDGRSENLLAAVAFGLTKTDGHRSALSWVELSTGTCVAMSGTQGQVLDEIAKLRPVEILVPELASGQLHDIAAAIRNLGIKAITARPSWQFQPHHAKDQINKQWNASTTAGFGFNDDDPAVFAAAAILSYLEETQKSSLSHLRPLKRHDVEHLLAIDPSTWRSLEVDRTVRSGGAEGSLLSAMDQTRTSMGGRMLRQWLRSPLRDIEHIQARQSAISALLEAPTELKLITKALDDVCDIERIIGRIAVGRVGPRDLAGLQKCLLELPALFELMKRIGRFEDVAPELLGQRVFCNEQAAFLQAAILPDPAPHLREGNVIATGFNAELDRLRALAGSSQEWLGNYQAQLSAESKIPTLKVSYNKVAGYYIEVTDAHRDKIPAAWTRKQTVKNAERYITSELKDFESETLTARDRSIALEQTLFENVRQVLLPHIQSFQELAASFARLDVLCCFATLAGERRYCRPQLDDSRVLEIIDGKHPVLEQQLGNEFVSNDVRFGDLDVLQLITGPNMAGKSTFIRQVALIVLMAQVGSYVPAKSVRIGLVDRLFARIGASDELHTGQSTFMVEMTETANILNNATEKSLVILDEIGRGTSTLDGLSLAWAISENLAEKVRARTLFATHYHELTDISTRIKGVKNLNVEVREWDEQVIFLHRIVDGGTDRSYGIHVARLAGVPLIVLNRARQLLGELQVHHVGSKSFRPKKSGANEDQMELFVDSKTKVIRAIMELDPNQLSPVAALAMLQELKKLLS